MKNQKRLESNKYKFYVQILAVALILTFIVFAFIYNGLETKSNTYKKLLSLSIETQSNDAVESAKGYLADAVQAYELKKFADVQVNCQMSRQKFAEANGVLRQLMVQIKNDKPRIFIIYAQVINKSVAMNDQVYEACEHFESASRYYEQYDETMAIKEMQAMNENILQHDALAGEYNDLLAEYKIEVDKLLQ